MINEVPVLWEEKRSSESKGIYLENKGTIYGIN